MDPMLTQAHVHCSGPSENFSKTDSKTVEQTETYSLRESDLLVLQVRAFLDASEDVDIDVETVEDLMQAISEHNQEDVRIGSDEEDRASPSDRDANGEDFDEDSRIDSEQELDISALYTIENEAIQTWTRQEMKAMMHHLKERGMSSWVNEYVTTRNIPIPRLLRAFGIALCPELAGKRPSTLLYFLKVAISRELRLRERLAQYNTIADAVHLIRSAQRILILTGAGISVSCGIPDFRSRDGLYASLKNRGDYDLDDPQQMFDINYFKENPLVFYQIYPSNFVPSPCHRFIKLIEDQNKLLRNYTQNIDTLETLAGVRRVLQCHGSFATASCLLCRRRVPGTEIETDILRQRVPLCTVCNAVPAPAHRKRGKKSKKKAKGQWDSDVEDSSDGPTYPPGIMKPDITFFGEKLADDFDRALSEDRAQVDLLLIIGTSLKVAPVADLISHIPHSIPQILINKTPIRHINPDIVLLGNADEIVEHLCAELDWQLPPPAPLPLPQESSTRLYPPRVNIKKRQSSEIIERQGPQQIGDSHVWLFQGAEGGKWVEGLQKEFISRTPSAEASGTNTRAETPTPVLDDTSRREAKKPRVQ